MSGVSIVAPYLGPDGWPFADVHPFPGATVDHVNGLQNMKQVYQKANPDYNGR